MIFHDFYIVGEYIKKKKLVSLQQYLDVNIGWYYVILVGRACNLVTKQLSMDLYIRYYPLYLVQPRP